MYTIFAFTSSPLASVIVAMSPTFASIADCEFETAVICILKLLIILASSLLFGTIFPVFIFKLSSFSSDNSLILWRNRNGYY